MSPEAVAAVISACGVILSLAGSFYVAGRRDGRIDIRLAMLEADREKMATKDQMASLKEDIAEIKGMFRMIPREAPP